MVKTYMETKWLYDHGLEGRSSIYLHRIMGVQTVIFWAKSWAKSGGIIFLALPIGVDLRVVGVWMT